MSYLKYLGYDQLFLIFFLSFDEIAFSKINEKRIYFKQHEMSKKIVFI